ncbi:hypothetical protein BGZ76_001778 [Entomortierella beljakovae]|nr:hypothetical protein BGZ76_001778 [Entomortierella beljakovae]
MSPSSMTIDGQALYIEGGITNTSEIIRQAFSIDLTQSWNINSPIYNQIPDGPRNGGIPNTLAPGDQGLVVISNGSVNVFDFQVSTWSRTFFIDNYSNITDLGAVTDPDTGIIYIPNGIKTDPKSIAQMAQLDITTKTVKSLKMDTILATHQAFSMAWSKSQQGMFVFGGVSGSTFSNALYMYNTAIGWQAVNTTGPTPPPRIQSCMSSLNNGTKLLLFGGFDRNGVPLGDIYILDTSTKTWTAGPKVELYGTRGAMACGVSHGQLIIWGGSINRYKSAPNSNILIYDTTQNVWKTEYTAPDTSAPSPSSGTDPSIPNPSNSESGSTKNEGPQTNTRLIIIVGASCGFLVLVLVVGSLVFRARSRRPVPPPEDPISKVDAWISGPLDSEEAATPGGEGGSRDRRTWTPKKKSLSTEGQDFWDLEKMEKLEKPEPFYSGAPFKKSRDMVESFDGSNPSIHSISSMASTRLLERELDERQYAKATRYNIEPTANRKPVRKPPPPPLSLEQEKSGKPEQSLTDNILAAYTMPSAFLPPVDHNGNPYNHQTAEYQPTTEYKPATESKPTNPPKATSTQRKYEINDDNDLL